jgi:hypothetical protein
MDVQDLIAGESTPQENDGAQEDVESLRRRRAVGIANPYASGLDVSIEKFLIRRAVAGGDQHREPRIQVPGLSNS